MRRHWRILRAVTIVSAGTMLIAAAADRVARLNALTIWPVFTVPAIVGMAAMTVWLAVRVLPPRGRALARAFADGHGALARVAGVRVRMNEGSEMAALRVVVAPRDREPYTTTLDEVDAAGAPATGDVIVVVRRDLDRPKAWHVPDPPAAWRAAADEGGEAIPEHAPVWRVRPRFSRRAVGVHAVITVLVGVAVFLPYRHEFGWGLQAMAEGTDPDDLTVQPRHREIAVRFAEAAGSGLFVEIVFSDHGYSLAWTARPGSGTTYRWTWWRGGPVEPWGESPGDDPGEVAAEAFGLDEVGWETLPAVREEAIAAAAPGGTDPEVSMRVFRDDPVALDGERGDVTIVVDVDGVKMWFDATGERTR